jgi:hypothetical protein
MDVSPEIKMTNGGQAQSEDSTAVGRDVGVTTSLEQFAKQLGIPPVRSRK